MVHKSLKLFKDLNLLFMYILYFLLDWTQCNLFKTFLKVHLIIFLLCFSLIPSFYNSLKSEGIDFNDPDAPVISLLTYK